MRLEKQVFNHPSADSDARICAWTRQLDYTQLSGNAKSVVTMLRQVSARLERAKPGTTDCCAIVALKPRGSRFRPSNNLVLKLVTGLALVDGKALVIGGEGLQSAGSVTGQALILRRCD